MMPIGSVQVHRSRGRDTCKTGWPAVGASDRPRRGCGGSAFRSADVTDTFRDMGAQRAADGRRRGRGCLSDMPQRFWRRRDTKGPTVVLGTSTARLRCQVGHGPSVEETMARASSPVTDRPRAQRETPPGACTETASARDADGTGEGRTFVMNARRRCFLGALPVRWPGQVHYRPRFRAG